MPSRPWPLWLLTGLLLAAFPAMNFVYWPQVLRSGVLPSDGDSIGIPMIGSVIATVMAAPIFFATAWFCLRRYNPNARLAVWRPDRPYRSVLSTIAFGGLAVILALGILADFADHLPWYE